MGYAIKRQPLTTGTPAAADKVRVYDASTGAESQATVQSLADAVSTVSPKPYFFLSLRSNSTERTVVTNGTYVKVSTSPTLVTSVGDWSEASGTITYNGSTARVFRYQYSGCFDTKFPSDNDTYVFGLAVGGVINEDTTVQSEPAADATDTIFCSNGILTVSNGDALDIRTTTVATADAQFFCRMYQFTMVAID